MINNKKNLGKRSKLFRVRAFSNSVHVLRVTSCLVLREVAGGPQSTRAMEIVHGTSSVLSVSRIWGSQWLLDTLSQCLCFTSFLQLNIRFVTVPPFFSSPPSIQITVPSPQYILLSLFSHRHKSYKGPSRRSPSDSKSAEAQRFSPPTNAPATGKRTSAKHVCGALYHFTYGYKLQAFELAILLISVTCNLLHHWNQRK